MSPLSGYFYVFAFLLIGAGFVVINSFLPYLIMQRSRGARASDPYESGEVPVGSAWIRFDIHYYLYALIFLVFDVEVVFLIPVLVVYKQIPGFLPFIEVSIFLGVLSIAIFYAWRRGFFQWK